MSLRERTCKTCGRSFEGGPRAWYCPTCRHERQKATNREHKRKKRMGLTRELGSIDSCKYCGKDYIVQGGLHEMCEDCKPVQYAKTDNDLSMRYYEENKEKINPARNERRRYSKRTCEICGKEIEPRSRALTCSDECKRIRTNQKWNERYHKRKKKQSKRIDITGERYGRLVAIKEVEPKGEQRRYLCKCDCGNEKPIMMSMLRNGNTKSCGCLQKEKMSEATLIDLTGKRFGRLTVIERVENRSYTASPFWLCLCDCGNITEVSSAHLNNNNTSSCGCLKKVTKEQCMNTLVGLYERFGIVSNVNLKKYLLCDLTTLRLKFDSKNMNEIWEEVKEEYERRKSDSSN